MSATILSTNAVKAAYDATAAVMLKWATAYDVTASDLANGANLRDIAEDWRKAHISPANKDSVGDMAEASRLAIYGADYASAVAEFFGEGTLKPAHHIIGKARKARGMAYVRAVLTALEDTLANAEDLTSEVSVAAIVRAIRTLEAAKREVPKDDAAEDDGMDVTTGDDDAAEGDEPATGERTPDAMLAALSGPTVALRDMLDADAQYDAARMDAWLTEVAAIARLHKGIVEARKVA